jgi:hypothetical protein
VGTAVDIHGLIAIPSHDVLPVIFGEHLNVSHSSGIAAQLENDLLKLAQKSFNLCSHDDA